MSVQFIDQESCHLLHAGDINGIQIPLDYETEKHRGFAFVEFELAEDAAAAMDNMNDGELFGRTIRVNLAKPMAIKDGSTRYCPLLIDFSLKLCSRKKFSLYNAFSP